jgi:hypothetical protein
MFTLSIVWPARAKGITAQFSARRENVKRIGISAPSARKEREKERKIDAQEYFGKVVQGD